MGTYMCNYCKYRIEKEKKPEICNYCGNKGGMVEVANAEKLLSELDI